MKTLYTHARLATLTAVAGLLMTASTFAHAQVPSGSLSGQLDIGSTGADVTKLQTLLASDVNIYPSGRITGYYGPLTAAAVTQFQIAYGLSPVGRVGPLTLAKVNSILAMPAPSIDIYAPGIANVSAAQARTSATITWTTPEGSVGKVYFNTMPILSQESASPMTEPYTSGSSVSESSFSTNHSVTLNNLAPGTTYYYVVQSRDSAGNFSVTLPFTFVTAQ